MEEVGLGVGRIWLHGMVGIERRERRSRVYWFPVWLGMSSPCERVSRGADLREDEKFRCGSQEGFLSRCISSLIHLNVAFQSRQRISIAFILWSRYWGGGREERDSVSLSLEMIAKAYHTSTELCIQVVAPSAIGQDFLEGGRIQRSETLHFPLCSHLTKKTLFYENTVLSSSAGS